MLVGFRTGILRDLAQQLMKTLPIELVPLAVWGEDPQAREITAHGAGLLRVPADTSEFRYGAGYLRHEWHSNWRDPLTCVVIGMGITHEVGGPVVLVLDWENAPEGLPLNAGDSLLFDVMWPPYVEESVRG